MLPGAGKRPLIVLSHGTGGSAAMMAWLGEYLASAGYVVAAANHHGNTGAESQPSAAGFMLWWERATDLSRLIDKLLQDSQFGEHIDSTKIGAGGFSLGGYTVLAMGGAKTSLARWEQFCRSPLRDATCEAQPEFPEIFAAFEQVRNDPVIQASLARHGESFRDSRIRAVFAIAPVGTMLTEQSLRAMQLPVRLVVGTADRTAPAETNARRLADLIPRAQLRVIEGAGHYTFLAECTAAGKVRRRELCDDTDRVDRATVHQTVSADALKFFSSSFARPN